MIGKRCFFLCTCRTRCSGSAFSTCHCVSLLAIETTYSNGSKKFHGERSNHEVYEFILDEDEFIIKVVAFSGYMVDNLAFITNQGKTYGPYGGDGGGERILRPPKEQGYLSHVSGSEANTQGSLGIVSLAFHWICYGSNRPLEGEDFDPDRQITSMGDSEIEDIYDSDRDNYGRHVDDMLLLMD